ncbi:M20/M25/M40 family metallo-hydrolase [bacterium]|nr:M20/M25/M40 family metallo-hydrolase [bacterium]
MKQRSIPVLLVLIGLCVSTAYSQIDSVVKKIIDVGTTDNRVMEHLDILSNRIGGRLIGSAAYEDAEKWTSRKFKEWGMDVELDEAGALPVGFNRGPWFGRMLSEDGMALHFVTPSYTAGTKGVQRGPVLIEPKTQRDFDNIKGALKGAWVLITGFEDGKPIDRSEEADARRATIIEENTQIAGKNREIRRQNRENRDNPDAQKQLLPLKDAPALFYKQMKEAGILGIIQSAPVPLRAVRNTQNILDMSWDNLPTLPDIRLDENQYTIIKKKVEERRYFLLEFDIRNFFRPGPVKYHNVIGIIRGTKYPNEYVIVSGHLDAYDVATGAIDCGVGVTAAMEAARLIMEAGGRPKRTILFMLFAGEEFGLIGSKSWVEKNSDKLANISNMINRDGGPSCPTGISVTKAMRKDIEKICEPITCINPEFPFEITERKPRNLPEKAWGTDSGPFAVKGVPTMGPSTGYPRGDNFSYREIWHTERDLYNKMIPDYQEHCSVVTAILAYGIANLDHLLSREGYYKTESTKEK